MYQLETKPCITRFQGNVAQTSSKYHLNTIKLKDKQRVKVPYGKKVWKEFKNEQKQKDYVRKQMQNILDEGKSDKQFIENYKITNLQFLRNPNNAVTFSKDDYSLEEKQKVQVCKHKQFPTKNYFNYLYDNIIKQQQYKIRNHFRKNIITNQLKQHKQYNNYQNNLQIDRFQDNKELRQKNSINQINFHKNSFYIKQKDRIEVLRYKY